jgi:DNA-binding ferritin-like protein
MSTNENTLPAKVAVFLGELITFRQSLKLTHWSITGPGSYEAHLSLDQAIDTFTEVTDRLVETTFAVLGTLDITIPETRKPANYVQNIESFYEHIEQERGIFTESFSQSIVDDFQEGIKQLLYRLKRLA